MGRRHSSAMSSEKSHLAPPPPSAAPPRTVKSSPPTTTRRPSMAPRPMTKFAGRNEMSLPFFSSTRPASDPSSRNEPGSSSRWMRSRTVSLPAAWCLATASSPPIWTASLRRCWTSSTSGCQPLGASLSIIRPPFGLEWARAYASPQLAIDVEACQLPARDWASHPTWCSRRRFSNPAGSAREPVSRSHHGGGAGAPAGALRTQRSGHRCGGRASPAVRRRCRSGSDDAPRAPRTS